MHPLRTLIAFMLSGLTGIAFIIALRVAVCGREWLVRRWWRGNTTQGLWRSIWLDEGQDSYGGTV